MLDTITPCSMAHLIRSTDELVHQHGGVITRIEFSKATQMSLEDFKTLVLPDLGPYADKAVIIQDESAKRLVRIIGDEVVVYDTEQIEDVFLDCLLDNLPNKTEMDYIPTTQYPIVRYTVRKDGSKGIIVSIPPKPFNMMFAPTMPYLPRSTRIYHPPLWMRVEMTPANMDTSCAIAVAPDRMRNPYDTKLYLVPFPNFGSRRGQICFGTTELQVQVKGAIQEGDTIQALYDRVFNSNFNDHLYHEDNYMDRLKALYDTLEKDPVLDAGVKKYSGFTKCMYMTLRILKDPNGWISFPYMPFPLTTREFLDWQK